LKLEFSKKDIQKKSSVLGNGTLVINDDEVVNIYSRNMYKPKYHTLNDIIDYEEQVSFCEKKAKAEKARQAKEQQEKKERERKAQAAAQAEQQEAEFKKHLEQERAKA
jgi:hypothetical protein